MLKLILRLPCLLSFLLLLDHLVSILCFTCIFFLGGIRVLSLIHLRLLAMRLSTTRFCLNWHLILPGGDIFSGGVYVLVLTSHRVHV